MSPKNSYEEVPYESSAMPACDPLRMATIANLFGLDVVDPGDCDVLDLGCGDAINLLSLAASYPGIRAVGFDPAFSAIERGEAWRAGAGLDNVTLLTELEEGSLDETADYVMAHGVLSWVEDEPRQNVIETAARAARPGGLVNFSYRAYPKAGYQLPARALARDAIAVASDAARAKGEQLSSVDQIRIGLERVALAASAAGTQALHGQHLASHLAVMQARTVSTLFHDDLNESFAPFRLSEVAEWCAAHGLRYVGELLPQDLWHYRLAPELRDTVREQAGPDAVRRQQLVDDLTNAGFHNSLFVKTGESVRSEPSTDGLTIYVRQYIRGTADGVRRADEISAPVAQVIREHEHDAITTDEIAAELDKDLAEVNGLVMQLETHGLARISTTRPPLPADPGEFPQTVPLVVEQIKSGLMYLTTRLHCPVRYEEEILRLFLCFLDGTRDRDSIIRDFPAVAAAAGLELSVDQDIPTILNETLQSFAVDGLLLAPESD